MTFVVTPAQAGVHVTNQMDSRSPAFAEDMLCGNDGLWGDFQERGPPQARKWLDSRYPAFAKRKLRGNDGREAFAKTRQPTNFDFRISNFE